MELTEISIVSGIARDVALVILSLVGAIVILTLSSTIRRFFRRAGETVDRINEIVDSVAAARDDAVELIEHLKVTTGAKPPENGGGGFNFVPWLFAPLAYFFRNRNRERASSAEPSEK